MRTGSSRWMSPTRKTVLAICASAGLLLFCRPSSAVFTQDLDNRACIGCHNPDILEMSKQGLDEQVQGADRPLPLQRKPPFVFGELSLSIDMERYGVGVHGGITCVECHQDVEEVPHLRRLKGVQCAVCHDVDEVMASAHGRPAGSETTPCIGCHDAHYGKEMEVYASDFRQDVCLECHNAYGIDEKAAHASLYEPELHLALACVSCHRGHGSRVHTIPAVETHVQSCESCHTKQSVVSEGQARAISRTQTRFLNGEVLKSTGYRVGAHRIPFLDALLVLLVIAPLGLVIVHGGLRRLTRRREPVELPEERILVYPFLERLWHGATAISVIVLIVTGAMIHWPERFPGWFAGAVAVHNAFGSILVLTALFWLVYNLATRRISLYIPKKDEIPEGMIKEAKFYLEDVFKHDPEPYIPRGDNEFSPLQKFIYLMQQAVVLPVLLISGVLYMFPGTFRETIYAVGGMTVLGVVHLILGALFASLLVAHVCLASTGVAIRKNYRAIIFGYGIKKDHEGGP